MRPLDELEATPLPGTEGANGFPFFSPDGEWVRFFANGELKKVSLAGGPPITIYDAGPTPSGHGAWTPQDIIVFSSANGLYRVSADGGTPEVLAIPATEKGERSYHCPKILPGGSSVLFDSAGDDGVQIRVLSLETGQQKIVVDEAINAYYLPTGHLVYQEPSPGARAVLAAPFDLASLEVTGDSVTILEGVRELDFAVSGEGTLVYVSGAGYERTLVWVDRDGTERVMTKRERNYPRSWDSLFRISPDGKRVAVTIADVGWKHNVWIYDSEEDFFTRLTLGVLAAAVRDLGAVGFVS